MFYIEQWCLAINNIDYVRQSIQPFVKELGMEDIVKQLADFRSPTAAEHCRDTLQLVMDNAVDTVKNKILDLLEIVVDKVSVEHCLIKVCLNNFKILDHIWRKYTEVEHQI